MQLTALMHQALTRANTEPLRRIHNPRIPGKPRWPAHPLTLHALEQHGLLARTRITNGRGNPVDLWTITNPGRESLQPVERLLEHRPVFLVDRRLATPDWRDPAKHPDEHREDYTRDRTRAIDDLEVIDPDHLSTAWARTSAARHADAQDRRRRARALASRVQAA